MKTGIVDVGGGLRGVYAAGVFDYEALKKNDYGILKASSSIPFVCKPCEINGIPYYDGALGDPVPVEKAF